MSTTCSIYSLISGEIARITTCPEEAVDTIYDPITEGIVAGAFIGTHYYFNGANAALKTGFPIEIDKNSVIANNLDKATFSNTPIGTSVMIRHSTGSVSHLITDTSLDFSTSIKDTYAFDFTNVKFLPLTVMINAN